MEEEETVTHLQLEHGGVPNSLVHLGTLGNQQKHSLVKLSGMTQAAHIDAK
jgi:hypothetical protein